MTFVKKISARIIITVSGVLLSVLILTSCEETVHLDLQQTPPKVIIEGLVTNKPGYQSVKISKSVDFYASGSEIPKVANAVVTVSDNLGNVYNFVHNPKNAEDSAGIYLPETPFVGTVGRRYKLSVKVDGVTYEAQDELFPVTTMDSLTYRVDENEEEDPEVDGRFYEVLLFTKEPRDQVNYYYFKFYRNDSLKYNSDTDIYFSNDEFLAEKIDGVESPIFFSKGDKCRVEMYSMSRLGYVYFSDLINILNNDSGGMFGPIPASPRTNLTNGALGFFHVGALDIGEVKIE